MKTRCKRCGHVFDDEFEFESVHIDSRFGLVLTCSSIEREAFEEELEKPEETWRDRPSFLGSV